MLRKSDKLILWVPLHWEGIALFGILSEFIDIETEFVKCNSEWMIQNQEGLS